MLMASDDDLDHTIKSLRSVLKDVQSPFLRQQVLVAMTTIVISYCELDKHSHWIEYVISLLLSIIPRAEKRDVTLARFAENQVVHRLPTKVERINPRAKVVDTT